MQNAPNPRHRLSQHKQRLLQQVQVHAAVQRGRHGARGQGQSLQPGYDVPQPCRERQEEQEEKEEEEEEEEEEEVEEEEEEEEKREEECRIKTYYDGAGADDREEEEETEAV
jgi:hypothetical protein